jgi:hypothetical protein
MRRKHSRSIRHGRGRFAFTFAVNQKLQIKPLGETVSLVGFNESESILEIYALQIIFSGKKLTGDYCAIDGEIGILGRDVLNEFSIIFDGINLEWKEQK